jgi:hypothetical protein
MATIGRKRAASRLLKNRDRRPCGFRRVLLMPAGPCNLGGLAAHQHQRAAQRALILPQLINSLRLVLLGTREK